MRPQDFSSEEAYNAYLEQREDMSINIFWLISILVQDYVEGRNLEEITRKLNQHKKQCQR
jgi:hypothetical protein